MQGSVRVEVNGQIVEVPRNDEGVHTVVLEGEHAIPSVKVIAALAQEVQRLRAPQAQRTCSTCKWAHDSARDPYDPSEPNLEAELYPHPFAAYPLVCLRTEKAYAHRPEWDGLSPEQDVAMMGNWCEGGWRGNFLVKPDFGCVEWEGKNE